MSILDDVAAGFAAFSNREREFPDRFMMIVPRALFDKITEAHRREFEGYYGPIDIRPLELIEDQSE